MISDRHIRTMWFGFCFVTVAAVALLAFSRDGSFAFRFEADDDADEASQYAVPENPNAAPRAANGLHAPPIGYLLRVSGDPALQDGETSVRVPVLMYHHIREIRPWHSAKDRRYSVTPRAFAAQMEGLVKAGYRTITPDDLERALAQGPSALPEKPVLLTFDDGFRDQMENALPVLEKFHLKATFFLISEQDKRGNVSDANIRELSANPLITIAAHTRRHPHVALLAAASRHAEIAGSKSDLEKLTGKPVRFFAYPFGSWSPRVEDEVKQDGFTLAFGIRLGSLHTPSSRFQLRRIRVQDGEDVAALADAFRQEH